MKQYAVFLYFGSPSPYYYCISFTFASFCISDAPTLLQQSGHVNSWPGRRQFGIDQESPAGFIFSNTSYLALNFLIVSRTKDWMPKMPRAPIQLLEYPILPSVTKNLSVTQNVSRFISLDIFRLVVGIAGSPCGQRLNSNSRVAFDHQIVIIIIKIVF